MEWSLSSSSLQEPVLWGCLDTTFELTTDSRQLAARASTVFAPWLRDRAGKRHIQWRVGQRTPTQWVVEDESASYQFDNLELALMMVEYGAIRVLVENCEYASLHSALLCRDGKGIAVVGPPESGKSTFALGLWQTGWSILCDDAILVDSASCRVHASPRRVSVRSASKALVGQRMWSQMLNSTSCSKSEKGHVFHPHEIDGRPRIESTKLDAIVFLARSGADVSGARAKPLDAAYALLGLLPYCNLTLRGEAHQALTQLRPLADSVPSFDLGRGPLPEMVQQVEGIVC